MGGLGSSNRFFLFCVLTDGTIILFDRLNFLFSPAS